MISFPAYVALSALSAAAVVSYAFATREQCVFFQKVGRERVQSAERKEGAERAVDFFSMGLISHALNLNLLSLFSLSLSLTQ